VQDTGCNRILQSHTVTATIETIDFVDLPEGVNTIDVLTINLFYGNSRVPLYYMPWTNFNAQLRYYQNNTGRPIAFSFYGPKKVFCWSEARCIVEGNDLVNANAFTSNVTYMASVNIQNNEYVLGFQDDGSAQYVNLTANTLGSIANAGTFSNTGVAITQWKNERALIIDPNNGYKTWDGVDLA
jgi:hypothetical protein